MDCLKKYNQPSRYAAGNGEIVPHMAFVDVDVSGDIQKDRPVFATYYGSCRDQYVKMRTSGFKMRHFMIHTWAPLASDIKVGVYACRCLSSCLIFATLIA